MRRLRAGILAVIAVLVTVLINGHAPSAVQLPPAGTCVHTYAYDSQHHAAILTDAATERGPPASYEGATTHDAVSHGLGGALARLSTVPTATLTTYDHPALLAQVASTSGAVRTGAAGDLGDLPSSLSMAVAANGAGKIPWTSWQNYPKVTQGGREYAQVGDRLYTRHAVDRMQPSGLGAPAGATGPGRSISPNYIEDVLGSTKGSPVKGPNGEARLSYTSGTVQVITEDNIVITVITR